ncbi:tyrosine-type recombinase/integrase [Phocaeicola dorei]|nr:tyrosine-type recombinase/integrase [Phocaeicola dorei]QJR68934.1 tyrosine-type recombinase/integrase [Phocaeicola dorei]QJR73264.1 tyrosine-type recombinase/integrase [Phocaeicola dorei]TDA98683.1 hypothetical protein E1I72_14985 [Phocaeicola dorei]
MTSRFRFVLFSFPLLVSLLYFHQARHTFATTVTLTNGVSIESVSKMLGHTNIRTTQIYAKVINQKSGSEMDALAGKLNVSMATL